MTIEINRKRKPVSSSLSNVLIRIRVSSVAEIGEISRKCSLNCPSHSYVEQLVCVCVRMRECVCLCDERCTAIVHLNDWVEYAVASAAEWISIQFNVSKIDYKNTFECLACARWWLLEYSYSLLAHLWSMHRVWIPIEWTQVNGNCITHHA